MSLENDNILQKINQIDSEGDWSKARRKVLYKDIVCLIKGCSVDLLSFLDVQKKKHLHQNQYLGLQKVPLKSIRGSVGRFNDFNAAFMPRNDSLKDRWKSVELGMLKGKMPPVDLYRVGEDYFVVDGNHRVSVANQLGWEDIEAYVTDFTGDDPEQKSDVHQMFLDNEQEAFLEKIGPSNEKLGHTIRFTCAGCYETLTDQVEEYYFGYRKLGKEDYTFERAFRDWYEEIYAPALRAIAENKLLDRFPDRTEADLYIWTAENSEDLTDIVMQQERID